MNHNKNLTCFAPWVHSYLGPRGQRGLCCEAKPFNQTEKSFNSYWNSEEIKEIRKMMLKGELPRKYCSVCLDGDMHSNLPIRSYQLSQIEQEEILSQTRDDGSYEGLPISLDYRGNNTCNLSCRTCSSVYSSKIAAVVEPSSVDNNVADRLEEQKELVNSKTRKLYYANGESFLQKSHWELLDSIYKGGHAKNIELVYNTNLQFPLSLIQKHREILSGFRKITLNVSIDGANEVGEFIRDGLSWEKFKKNVNKVKKDSLFKIDIFDITLTLPFLLDYKGLIDFIVAEQVYAEVHLIVEGGFYQMLLSPYLIGPNELVSQCQEIIEYINSKQSTHLAGLKKVLITLKECAHRVERESYSIERISEAIKLASKMDRKFKRKDIATFYSKFPLTKKIIDQVNTFVEQEKRQYQDSPDKEYWESFGENILLFPEVGKMKERLEKEKGLIHSFIVSDATLLSRFLSKGEFRKYDAQSFLEELMKGNDFLVKKERLGSFGFLLRRSKWKFISQMMDFITAPLRSLIGFHCRYIILPKE